MMNYDALIQNMQSLKIFSKAHVVLIKKAKYKMAYTV